MKRRHLLQWTACSPLALGLATPLRAEGEACVYPLADGTALRVDAACVHFDGDGLYLYPAWGRPQVYRVQTVDGGLAFHDPRNGCLCWQALGVKAASPRFAGRVSEHLSAGALQALASSVPLQVPRLPG